MKRKVFFFAIMAASFGMIIFLLLSLKTKRDKLCRQSFSNENLAFFDLNGKVICPFSKNKAGVLINFNSECEHCQNEIKELNRNSNLFKRNTVFFVSDEPVRVLRGVDSVYGISEKAVFTILYDSMKTFEKKFGNRITPAILLFDKKGILIKEYSGEVSAGLISKSLNRGRIEK